MTDTPANQAAAEVDDTAWGRELEAARRRAGARRIATASSVADIHHLFTYHAPTSEQVARYEQLRAAGLELALTIHAHCPAGPDRSAAIRKVREAVMTANAAIACGDET